MKKTIVFILCLWLISISVFSFAESNDIPEYISWEQITSGGVGTYESKKGITHVMQNGPRITVSGGAVCDLDLSGTDFPGVTEFSFNNLTISGNHGVASAANLKEAIISANRGEVLRIVLSEVKVDVNYFTCCAKEGKLIIVNNNDIKRLTVEAQSGGEVELINTGDVEMLWIDAMFDSLCKIKNEGNCDGIEIWADNNGHISGINDGDARYIHVSVYGNCKTDWINNGDIEELRLLHGEASETNLVLNGNLSIDHPNRFDDTYTAIADIHDDSMIHIWGNGKVFRKGIHNERALMRAVVFLNDKQYAEGADTELDALALIKKNFMMDLSMIVPAYDGEYVDAVVWYNDLSGNSQKYVFSLEASMINKPLADQRQKDPSYGEYPCFRVTGTEQTLNPMPLPTPDSSLEGDIVDIESAFDNLLPVKVPTLVLPDGTIEEMDLTLKFTGPIKEGKNDIKYDVRLVDSEGNKVELPKECILCFPYPEGLDETSENKYRIMIHHFRDEGMEKYSTEDGTIELKSQGLCIRLSSLSPFIVEWEELPETDMPQTGDDSNITLWLALLTMAGVALLKLKRKNA